MPKKHYDHREVKAEHLKHYDGRNVHTNIKPHYDGRAKVNEHVKSKTPAKTHVKNPHVGKLGSEKVKSMEPPKTHAKVDPKHHAHLKEHHKHVKTHLKHLDGLLKGHHHKKHHKSK